MQGRCWKERESRKEMSFPTDYIKSEPTPTLIQTPKRLLTFPPLPLLHDGLQPLLLLLRGLGHADEPLVLGRVVDLPAVVHDVPAAVVVSCEAWGGGEHRQTQVWLQYFYEVLSRGRGWKGGVERGKSTHLTHLGLENFFEFEGGGPSISGGTDHDNVNRVVGKSGSQ